MGSNFVSLGKDWDVQNFDVTDSAKEITSTNPVKSFVLQTSDNVPIEYRRESGGNTWTVKSGGHIAGDVLFVYDTGIVSMGFVRAPGGAAAIEVIEIF